MNRLLCTIAMAALMCANATAQQFDKFFADSTLRLDYIFAGDTSRQAIYVDGQCLIPRWDGRRQRLDELPVDRLP